MAKRHHMTPNGPIPFTEEEETKKDAEEAQWAIDKAEYDANQYQRDRQAEYPAIVEQLDEIYHNGIDSWKAVIKVTKDKYPKG